MKYVAFFRGINVGGKNKVKMDDLKQFFYDCGFREVKTYIQSGNVIFASDMDRNLLPDTISHAFNVRFGFQSNVILRSGTEIDELISALPFTKEQIEKAEAKTPGVEHLYVFMSNDVIGYTANEVEALRRAYQGEDELCLGKREFYLLCSHSIRDSKLAAALPKLDASLTSRNWKTMLKIKALID